MATAVEMPQLGNTVEECVLTRWLKHKGDPLAAGDIVAEIETDKTTFEVASPVDGTVLATFFEEGALVPVFTNIFVVGMPGEPVDAFRPPQRQGPAQSASESPSPQTAEPATSRLSNPAPPRAGEPAILQSPVALSPRASRLAAQLGLEAAALSGSGPGGRVLERDVRRAHESRSTAEPAAPKLAEGSLHAAPSAGRPVSPELVATETPSAPSAGGPVSPKLVAGSLPAAPSVGGRTAGLRATLARRMRESLVSTAQYTLNMSADATSLLALRARIKSSASEGAPDLTINDLVTFCTIQALLDVPALNAEYIDGRIVQHSDVHIAFAVDTPRGLLAPVVRNAHDLSVTELSLRTKRLTAQALEATISPDDLTGATFTISNLGSLGVESFTPLINPPQVAILGVDAIGLKPVRRRAPRVPLRLRETSSRRAAALAESIEFVDAIGLSLTCDHQVIDGAPGARFLQVLRQKIEHVETLVEM